VSTLPVGGAPFGIAVDPVSSQVYVSSAQVPGRLLIVDPDSGDVDDISVGSLPFGVAVHPNGGRVYIANAGGNNVSIVDIGSLDVTTVAVGQAPFGISIDLAGQRVFVANRDSGNVSVIDTAIDQVIATIPVGNRPIAFGVFVGPEL
jgi:YVTN family beta-propeller protein